MPNLTIIIGSTRPGRAGVPIAQWFAGRAKDHAGFDVTVVDLADVDLPMLDEPDHPRLRQYVHQHTRDWSAIVDAADAFVIVTPEDNYGYPATVKSALDCPHQEWQHKPVGFVSYGAGTRAVRQLKQVVTALRMLPVVDSFNIPSTPSSSTRTARCRQMRSWSRPQLRCWTNWCAPRRRCGRCDRAAGKPHSGPEPGAGRAAGPGSMTATDPAAISRSSRYLALELRFTLPRRAAKHMVMLITPTTAMAATAWPSWVHCQPLPSTIDRRPPSR